MKAAEDLSKELKEISVAEFFEKNRHLLGYENSTRALITIVKEAVDNSLDACEEAGILPEIKVSLKELEDSVFKITVEDNGPGIIEDKVHLAFGKLLYGSKFHRLRQSRGTQGIGISGAILYSQLTTGKPIRISSSTGKKINTIEMLIDVVKNAPSIISQQGESNQKKWHGIKIEMQAKGRYIEGFQSIIEYLRQTAIMNPYAKIIFKTPNDHQHTFSRVINKLPPKPKEIKPHPYGVEIGILRRMIQTTKSKNILSFLMRDFSRVGKRSATQILKLAKIDNKKKPHSLTHDEIDKIHNAMHLVKLIAPPTDCLSPVGDEELKKGLEKEIKAEHYVSVSRPTSVYRGMPFSVECALAYGGDLENTRRVNVLRFANKVPLLYNQGDCAITKAVVQTDWRRYGISQSFESLPNGPLAILVHFVSAWVPYTSEGKQAIASYPEIIKEIKLALQDAGRKMKLYISKRRRKQQMKMRQNLFEKYIPEVSEGISKISETSKEKIRTGLEKILESGAKKYEKEDQD